MRHFIGGGPMYRSAAAIAVAVVLGISAAATASAAAGESESKPADPIQAMVGRLDLEKYKATIKGLTKFGDRRQGTDRNRDALDWIEAQLKSYGCTNTERLTYPFGEERTHYVA